jgi:hypothetical protein
MKLDVTGSGSGFTHPTLNLTDSAHDSGRSTPDFGDRDRAAGSPKSESNSQALNVFVSGTPKTGTLYRECGRDQT